MKDDRTNEYPVTNRDDGEIEARQEWEGQLLES